MPIFTRMRLIPQVAWLIHPDLHHLLSYPESASVFLPFFLANALIIFMNLLFRHIVAFFPLIPFSAFLFHQYYLFSHSTSLRSLEADFTAIFFYFSTIFLSFIKDLLVDLTTLKSRKPLFQFFLLVVSSFYFIRLRLKLLVGRLRPFICCHFCCFFPLLIIFGFLSYFFSFSPKFFQHLSNLFDCFLKSASYFDHFILVFSCWCPPKPIFSSSQASTLILRCPKWQMHFLAHSTALHTYPFWKYFY